MYSRASYLSVKDCVAGRVLAEGDEAVTSVFVVVSDFDSHGKKGGGQEVQTLG